MNISCIVDKEFFTVLKDAQCEISLILKQNANYLGELSEFLKGNDTSDSCRSSFAPIDFQQALHNSQNLRDQLSDTLKLYYKSEHERRL